MKKIIAHIGIITLIAIVVVILYDKMIFRILEKHHF